MSDRSLVAAANKALRAKNAPWMLALTVGGLIALVAAVGDGGFFYTLAFDRGRHESAFHAAWICGMVLGLTAALFDTALGVTDYLRQRPVSASQLFAVRARAVLAVLVVWFLGVPICAGAWMLLFESRVGFDLGAVWSLWCSMVGALSAAAIGVFCGTLPLACWLRPVIGAAAFGVVFSAIDRLTMLESGYHSQVGFIGAHLGLTLLFGWLAWSVRGLAADADRAWPWRLRVGAGTAAVFVIVALVAGALAELEHTTVWWLRNEYPTVVVHAGEAKLIDRDSRWRQSGAEVLDANHVPTGEVIPRGEFRDVEYGWRHLRRWWLGFDQPRWHPRLQNSGWWIGPLNLYLTHDGRAWLHHARQRHLQPTGIGPEHRAFAAGAQLHSDRWRDGQSGWTVVYEPESEALYRFDVAAEHFVPFELPAGDRLVRVDRVTPVQALFGPDDSDNVLTLRGEKGAYVLRHGAPVEVELAPESEDQPSGRNGAPDNILGVIRGGPIFATVEVPAGEGRAAFTHEFRPHTRPEYGITGVLLALAAVQPPMVPLLLSSFGIGLLSLALAGLAAWLTIRRLRRLGAPPAVQRHWGVLALLGGPTVWLLSLCFERPRAHAARPVAVVPTPRIVTALQEIA